MRLFIIICFILYLCIILGNAQPTLQSYTACYVCTDGTYVKYIGKDTYLMRKEALVEFGCEVKSRVWNCESNKIVRSRTVRYYQRYYKK